MYCEYKNHVLCVQGPCTQSTKPLYWLLSSTVINASDMKIGDKVVFLSETGGGTVAGFQGKNIVLVEDADGFQIPMTLNDVVVVDDTNDYSSAHSVESRKKKADVDDNVSVNLNLNDKREESRAEAQEREGGDVLSVWLAFVPVDARDMSNTTFECYIVNDSNFFINFTYLSAEASRWSLRHTDVVEPNTKYFIEELSHSQISEIEHVQIQFIAYKHDKPFLLKAPVSADLRIDGVKFFKLHTFRQNIYFEQPALLFPLVEKEEAKPIPNTNKRVGEKKQDEKEILVVDLHSSELLETTSGMNNTEILQYQLREFNSVMKEQMKNRGKKIVFIHGKGQGILRQAILHELRTKYKSCMSQDASFREYGYGATQVTIR